MTIELVDTRDQLFLVALDTETTGLDCQRNDPIEIALKVIGASTGKEYGSLTSVIRIDDQAWNRASPRALEVNNFTWQEIKERGETVEVVARKICDLFSGLQLSSSNAKFICQNPSFDRGFFDKIVPPEQQREAKMPYHWLGLESMYHSQRIAKLSRGEVVSKVSYSKDAIARELDLAPEEKPHRAMNGVNHLLAIYRILVGYPCSGRKPLDQLKEWICAILRRILAFFSFDFK